jgi:phage shock protein B
MEDVFLPIVICGMLFVGMPWIILHYITKWKQSPSLTGEDEKLLDELHHMARRLDERLETIERIVAADNPDFRPTPPRPTPEDDQSRYDYSRRN